MDPWLESFARACFQRSADTAHDLKTPLNVAVLNLELLRMRLRKLVPEDDEKVAGYTRAIESELRRMGRIFDAYFLMSTPPKNEGLPAPVDVAPICIDASSVFGVTPETNGPALVDGHESRIRQAYKLFFEGAAKLFASEGRTAAASRDDEGRSYTLTAAGRADVADFEPTKLFKLYYTDAEGNPDLSLAVARLIAETYGGELNAAGDRDKVSLRLSFPLGAR
ncbi:MAG TPA: histidine kinase dimerization/phospho-acceptor domain-containing protein [Thermoanaerobaculia bacterium]|nr:histidine kinase dimerization/phospho-acceptor domain-containing protein [Thermoanaerobaculia bacterium]